MCRLLIALIFLTNTAAAQFVHRSDSLIVDAKGANLLLRGMGLGGWMLQEPYMLKMSGIAVAQYDIREKIQELVGEELTEKFYQTWLNNHTTESDIDSLAAWGFNSVRLPMHYNLLMKDDGIIDSTCKGWVLIDNLVRWCRKANIYCILDLHAAQGGQGHDNAISDRDSTKGSLWTSTLFREHTIKLWSALAEKYKNEPVIAAYDILNEPNWGFQNLNDRNGCAEKDNTELKSLYIDITKAIREKDKNHLIIIEGNCWGNNYAGMFPLWDDNMALSFHKYWNYNNIESIQHILEARRRENVPVWLGETGENSNAWFTDAISLLEENNIGWAMWPLKKIGKNNNPLEIESTPGYDTLRSYWQNKAPKPEIHEAGRILMNIAERTNIKYNSFHYDVIDAMFRQVHSEQTIPFRNQVLKNVLKIEAEDYDLGRSGVAYHDTDSAEYWVSTGLKRTGWNTGGAYRNDGVDIAFFNEADQKNFYLTDFKKNEWLNYTIESGQACVSDLSLRIRCENPSNITIRNLSGSVALSANVLTGNWQKLILKGLVLNKGKNTIQLNITEGKIDLDYFEITPITKLEH